MDTEELSRIIERLRLQGADDEYVEAKACRKKLSNNVWESVSAFANTRGGILLLGVDESEGFVPAEGFSPDKVVNQFVDGMGDGGENGAKVANPPQYHLSRIEFEGKQIVSVEIEELDPATKPCYVIARSITNGSYKRVDDKDIRLQPAELYELQNALVPTQSDRAIVSEAHVDDLDRITVDQIIAHEQRVGSRALRDAPNQQTRLARLNLTDNEGNVRLAGLLVAGIYPQQYFPKLVVDVAVHPDVKKSAPGRPRFLDRRVCDGPIGAVIEDALTAIIRNLRTYSVVRGSGRVDEPEIPISVLREALVNALVHREYGQYFLGQAVSVDIYPDRVEITNPGGLWGGKSLETLDDGTSRCRNDTLMRLLTSVELPTQEGVPAEGNGSGVSMMKREMASRALDEPTFIARIDSFTVILGRGGTEIPEMQARLQELSSEPLDRLEQTVLLLALRRHGVSIAELHKALSIDSDEARSIAKGLIGKSPLIEVSPDHFDIAGANDAAPSASKASQVSANEKSHAVLECLKGETPSTTRDIAKKTGMSINSIRYYLRKLQDEGLVEATAPSTSTKRAYILTTAGMEALDNDAR
ncbi:MAG: ATP-binding protein [Coriobacteriales bacterium]